MKNTKMLVLIILIAAVTAGTLTFWDTVTDFLVAAVFAYILSPATDYIVSKAGLRRGVAVGIVFFIFVFILIFVVSVTAPNVVAQLSDLISEIRRYADNFDEILASVNAYLEQLHLPKQVLDTLTDFVSESDTYILSFIGSMLTSIAGLSMRILDLVVLVILIIYFLLDGEKLIGDAINALPERAGLKVRRLLDEANDISRKYLRSRIIVSGGMAVVTFIGLKIMGIKYALLFALMSFVLDFIPYFGSLIAGVIEAFYALLTGGVTLAVAVAVFVLVVQQIEGNIVGPKLQADAVGIHPVTVMFALLACNKIWGTMGMIVSTPVAAVVKLVFREMYQYVVSEDEPGLPPPAEGA